MDEAFCRVKDLDEDTEVFDSRDLALVALTHPDLASAAADRFCSRARRFAVLCIDCDQAFIVDRNLGARSSLEFLDVFPLGPDEGADEIFLDPDGLDLGGVFGDFIWLPSFWEDLFHFLQDVVEAPSCLGDRLFKDFFLETSEFVIHLERCDSLGGPCDFEVHVP